MNQDLRAQDSIFKKTQYQVEGFVKPGIDFKDLARDIFNTTLQYGQDDYVIVMFNTHNVSNSKDLNLALKFLAPLSKLTNLLILSECNKLEDHRINDKIVKYLNNYCSRNKNISIKFFANAKQTKYKICRSIMYNIIKFSKLNLNKKTVIKTIEKRISTHTTIKDYEKGKEKGICLLKNSTDGPSLQEEMNTSKNLNNVASGNNSSLENQVNSEIVTPNQFFLLQGQNGLV